MPAFTQAYARGAAMWTCLHISDAERAKYYAQLTLNISREKGFHYFSTAAQVVFGWAKVWEGDATGLADLTEAIERWRKTGQTMGMPAFMLQQARALRKLGRNTEALKVLQDPLYQEALPKEPWIEHLAEKMMSEELLTPSA